MTNSQFVCQIVTIAYIVCSIFYHLSFNVFALVLLMLLRCYSQFVCMDVCTYVLIVAVLLFSQFVIFYRCFYYLLYINFTRCYNATALHMRVCVCLYQLYIHILFSHTRHQLVLFWSFSLFFAIFLWRIHCCRLLQFLKTKTKQNKNEKL